MKGLLAFMLFTAVGCGNSESPVGTTQAPDAGDLDGGRRGSDARAPPADAPLDPFFGAEPVCLHDPCTTGAYLDPRCSPCIAAICEEDDICCGIIWDEACVLTMRTLEVCECAAESMCDDVTDDDADGAVDCADDDCAGSAACLPGESPIGSLCTRHSDCAAVDGRPLCLRDPMASAGFCSGYCEMASGACGPSAVCLRDEIGYDAAQLCFATCDPDIAESCSQGQQCIETDGGFACLRASEDCSSPEDDDLDGATNCADADCIFEAICVEDCTNGVDDNADGIVDCADPLCRGALQCDDPVCDPPAGDLTSTCVMYGGFVECNPINNAGCGPEQVCDLALGGYRCEPATERRGLCEPCVEGGCAAGSTCIGTGPPGPDPSCWRFCCADVDCGDRGFCNKNITTQIIGQFSHIGICGVKHGDW